jgi:hypothetical protein
LAEEINLISGADTGVTPLLSVSASRSILKARAQIESSAPAEGIEGKLSTLSRAVVDGLHGVSLEMAFLLALRLSIPGEPTAGNFPRFTGTGRAVEERTPAQVRSDIGAAAAADTIAEESVTLLAPGITIVF